MTILIISGLIVAIVAILFAFQNSTVVVISLGVWQFQQSLAIILLITLGLGIIISLLLSIPTIIKRGLQTIKQRQRIQALESELQSSDTDISQQKQQSKIYEQKNEELVQAFGLNDSVTGLLKEDSAVILTNYLLQQVSNQSSNSRYNSLCVFLLSIEPAQSDQSNTLEKQENAIYRAISNRLSSVASADSFIGVTNNNIFIYLTLGLIGQEATEHGEYLIEKLTESPLQKADGTTLPLKVFVGGAIADSAYTIDSHQLLKQAEQNIKTAKERKRSSIVVTGIITDV